MASTFGILNSAYSGLTAAKAALDVAGQNIANVNTEGYVRQRVQQAAVPGTQTPALFSKGAAVGAGVTVLGVARLNDSLIDTRARDTASTSGYWNTAAAALSGVEGSLNEPGANGLSASLNEFWSGWQNMANSAGSSTAASQGNVLIGQGQQIAAQLKAGYSAAATGWSGQYTATKNAVTAVNGAAQRIATLNTAILRTTSSGGNPNELMDQRDAALATISNLTGATTRPNPDGTMDVLVGGNALVSGSTARSLEMAGTTDLSGAASSPVSIRWADTKATASIDGGTVAAQLATLAGANGGTGGIYAETADVYNRVATALATTVDSALQQGVTPSGASVGTQSFFSISGNPAATSLTVVARSSADIAINSAPGRADGAIADQLSQKGTVAGGADATWASFVANIGVQSKNAATQSTIAASAATAATTARTSQNGVDLDEESTNLITFQHAYQAAARVMTTIDSVLDTLINHTGLV